MVADQTAEWTVKFCGNSSGQHLGGHSSRLGDDYAVRLTLLLTVHREVLRNLRRLAAASETFDDDDSIFVNSLENLLLVVENAKPFPGAFLIESTVLA